MILDEIVTRKKKDLAARQAALPLDTLTKKVQDARRESRDFKGALCGHDLSIIGEIKKASPSRGVIREDFDPAALAQQYAGANVQALSVLTEEHFFQGDRAYPAQVRKACGLPILRKDFIIDAWQIWESALLGVDAVLLITAILSPTQLSNFLSLARDLGLEALTEVHDKRELDMALHAKARIIGINNRNLYDFSENLSTTERLVKYIPTGKVAVAESGIHTPEDAARMKRAGVNALLIGEAFMRAGDIPSAVAALREKSA
jgi:indole-3-glycerol phosphate synthase